MAKRRITMRDRRIDAENGRKAKGSQWHIEVQTHKNHKYHITLHDREIDSRNGKKAKGWNKRRKHSKAHKKYHITAHDRRVDRRNGKKAKDWELFK